MWRKLFSPRRIAATYAVDRAQQAVDRGCIGRIVGLIVLVTMVACVGLWGLAYHLLNKSGVLAALPERIAGPAIGITLIGGFAVAIVVGGVIGDALRRAVWRLLFR